MSVNTGVVAFFCDSLQLLKNRVGPPKKILSHLVPVVLTGKKYICVTHNVKKKRVGP